MTIPKEYIATVPQSKINEFNELINSGDETLINEAFVRFSTLGTEKKDKALSNLSKQVNALEKILKEGVSDLNSAELIPGTRKERFSDTFSILKEDIVKRYKKITGES